MEQFEVFTKKFNLLLGGLTALLGILFDQMAGFFLAFLILNILDWITGNVKSHILGTLSSTAGARGIIKKIGYWIVIGITFFISVSCTNLGSMLGYDLHFLQLLGYFTLATYIINEIRSIIENLVQMDVELPAFLQTILNGLAKGLQVTAQKQFNPIEQFSENKNSNNTESEE